MVGLFCVIVCGDCDFVVIIVIGVCWIFEVWCIDEGYFIGVCINVE